MSDRLRLLFVVGNFVAGGAERHLLELWRRMDRRRFEIEICCFRAEGQFLDEVRALGWPIHDLGLGPRILSGSGLRGLARLITHARRFHPHVVHGYLFGPNLFAVIAGRLTGVPVVAVAKRNVDAFETGRQRALQRVTHRWATHVTAVSEAVANSVSALGVPRARITVIPNGVDAARFDSVVEPRDPVRDPVVGSVGCLAPRKDYGTLMEALALLMHRGRTFQAVLVGDGPDRAALEARREALGLRDRVTFLGERADVERLLLGFDVFVLSSREEGIPNALLEAMAAGRPAVATAVGGTPEVMEAGVTGWLVPPEAPAALADALDEALTQPAEARRRGEAARRAVQASMGIETMARRHEAFYERAVAEARR